jgi:hypothetical protein
MIYAKPCIQRGGSMYFVCYHEPPNIRTRLIILHYENLNTPPSKAKVQSGQEIGQGGELLEEVVPAVLPDCLHDEVGK